jgi:hypothetical protein
MAYRKIDPTMWDDEQFIGLESNDTRLLFVYLLTGPDVTPLPGLIVTGAAAISEGLRMGFETVSKGLAELSRKGRIEIDARHRVIRIPNAPRYNAAENPNVLKGFWNHWKKVPESPLKYAHLASLEACIDPADAKMVATWRATFGTVPRPSGNGFETVTPTVTQTVPEGLPKPFRTPDPDPDPDPLPSASRAHASEHESPDATTDKPAVTPAAGPPRQPPIDPRHGGDPSDPLVVEVYSEWRKRFPEGEPPMLPSFELAAYVQNASRRGTYPREAILRSLTGSRALWDAERDKSKLFLRELKWLMSDQAIGRGLAALDIRPAAPAEPTSRPALEPYVPKPPPATRPDPEARAARPGFARRRHAS